jgi:MoxR-like ATPase
MRFTLGYVQPGEEVAVLSAQEHNHPLDELQPCASLADARAKRAAQDVRISEELKRYVVDLVGATRTANGVQLAASPRASSR